MTDKVTVQVVGLHPLIHPVTAKRFEHGQPVEIDSCAWITNQLAAGSMKQIVIDFPEVAVVKAPKK